MQLSNDLCQVDNFDLRSFSGLASRFGQDRYSYVVTPNVDHLLRLHDDSSFRDIYAEAGYVLLDSRFLSHFVRFTRGFRLPVCTGSDLTECLFSNIIEIDDQLVVVGGTEKQAHALIERYGLRRLAHFNPAMGFIHDPAAVDACLRFIEAHSPFRFCFLAVGAPQQEMLARQLKLRGHARGLALCIGSAINFLTGIEQRAPRWMQNIGAEWLYRVIRAPGRMARRYLLRGPRIFALLRHAEITLKPALPAS